MGSVICALIGSTLGLLIGFGWGWARAMREAGAMRAMLAHKTAGPAISDGRWRRLAMRIDLTREEAVALLSLLNRAIENDRYPLSPRIRTLRGIRAKLPGAPPEAPPAKPATPEEGSEIRLIQCDGACWMT
jgi:hypothetical protein